MKDKKAIKDMINLLEGRKEFYLEKAKVCHQLGRKPNEELWRDMAVTTQEKIELLEWVLKDE